MVFFVMTKVQAQIIELFKTLDPAEQREVAEQLYERTTAGSFYDRMTPEQRAELDEGIAQAERGQVLPKKYLIVSPSASASRLDEDRRFSGHAILLAAVCAVHRVCAQSKPHPPR
jgi:hypothetical protein